MKVLVPFADAGLGSEGGPACFRGVQDATSNLDSPRESMAPGECRGGSGAFTLAHGRRSHGLIGGKRLLRWRCKRKEEIVPLLDHLRSPLNDAWPWDGVHANWATKIADQLNAALLPPDYHAISLIKRGQWPSMTDSYL